MIQQRQLTATFLFSILVVWSHWNIVSVGVTALGINFTLFWFGFAILIYSLDSSYRLQRDWVWIFPVFLITLSYSIYENPWLKLISFFLLPLLIGIFSAYSHLPEHDRIQWNAKLSVVIAKRFLTPLCTALQLFPLIKASSQEQASSDYSRRIVRIIKGLLILLPLAFIATSLLASADSVFAEFISQNFKVLFGFVSWITIWKLTLALSLSISLLAIAIGWRGRIDYSEASETATIDGLVAGIVLSGLLIIYILFLSLQQQHLTITELPGNYREAELLVKTGFWQLFILSMINVGLFFTVYRKTGTLTQWILRLFILSSSLLMLSAAWKVGLYSYTFGLSYEKFFACYTALFALGVLSYLVIANFLVQKRNIVKIIAFAALWAYSLATISPVEKIIFHANLYFSKQEKSRIVLSQLTQLSLDILADVDEVPVSKLVENKNHELLWQNWRMEQRGLCKRPWFEFSFSAITACNSHRSHKN